MDLLGLADSRKLFVAIQAFLVVSNFVAKSSFALLVTRLTGTQTTLKRVSIALSAVIATLGVIAALVVITPCWPDNDSKCFQDVSAFAGLSTASY